MSKLMRTVVMLGVMGAAALPAYGLDPDYPCFATIGGVTTDLTRICGGGGSATPVAKGLVFTTTPVGEYDSAILATVTNNTGTTVYNIRGRYTVYRKVGGEKVPAAVGSILIPDDINKDGLGDGKAVTFTLAAGISGMAAAREAGSTVVFDFKYDVDEEVAK